MIPLNSTVCLIHCTVSRCSCRTRIKYVRTNNRNLLSSTVHPFTHSLTVILLCVHTPSESEKCSRRIHHHLLLNPCQSANRTIKGFLLFQLRFCVFIPRVEPANCSTTRNAHRDTKPNNSDDPITAPNR